MKSQSPPRPTTLADLNTPALLLDLSVLQRNLSAMSARMKKHGVALRPHLKTAKSIEVARRATEGHFGGITVSTLREAEYFVEQGMADVTYAVNIVPDKLATVARLQRTGAWVNVLTDDVEVAKAIGARADALSAHLRVFIKIDTGYHRAGVEPESDELLAIGRTLAAARKVELRGVLLASYRRIRLSGLLPTVFRVPTELIFLVLLLDLRRGLRYSRRLMLGLQQATERWR